MTAPGPVVLVVNATATRTSAEVRRQAEIALGPLGLAAVEAPRGVDAAREAVRRAVADGAATVVALGGDGTVALAAGILAGGPVALLPLPGGSTNVFARGLGWPANPLRAVEAIAGAMGPDPRVLRVGRVVADGRESVAIVNAGIGVDAAAADWVERHPRAKRRLRQGAFAAAAAGPGVRALHGAPVHLRLPDSAAPIDVHALVVAWGRPYAYVGPRAIDLLPQAAWDGRLAWIALPRPSVIGSVRLFGRALRGGDGAVAPPGSIGGLTEGSLVVTSEAGVPVQADGDPLGRVHHLELGPGPAIRVRCPVKSSGGSADTE